MAAPGTGLDLSPQICRLTPTVKHTGQESGCKLCEIFELLQLLGDYRYVLQTIGVNRSIGVHDVTPDTPSQFLAMWCAPMWAPRGQWPPYLYLYIRGLLLRDGGRGRKWKGRTSKKKERERAGKGGDVGEPNIFTRT